MLLTSLVFVVLISSCWGRSSVAKQSYQAPVFYTITTANRTHCPETPENRPPNRVDTALRVRALREAMNDTALNGGQPLAAYITLIADDHGVLPAAGTAGSAWDARVSFISGFTGSSGYTIVTQNEAALWTDGRYFLQGETELDCSWLLMKLSTPGYVGGPQWLADTLPANSRVGAYPNYLSIETWNSYSSALRQKNITLVEVREDLVDIVWENQKTTVPRDPKPNEPIFVHTLEFTGETWQSKVAEVRKKLNEPADKSADCFVATILDDVNWLFNLRGNDRTNSMFYGYGMVCKESILYPVRLYIVKVQDALNNTAIREHLNLTQAGQCINPLVTCVQIRNYIDIITDIQNLPTSTAFWLDTAANYAIYSAANRNIEVRLERSPIALMKAIKNQVERDNYYRCNIRDSAALIEFVSNLEAEVKAGVHWTEVSAAERVKVVRSTYQHNKGISFDTIAGSGENGAVIHYRPTAATNRNITTQELFLFDSGGQYLDGTTDVTRTFHFGVPKDVEKEAYTRVLMGAIDLATTVWPDGLYGSDIDVRARTPLWQHGWDYNHGTGHGIGYFLSVHEGPGRINIGFNNVLYTPLYEGMFFSDEPGYYENGQFGVRLETLVGVVEANTPHRFDGKKFLAFRPATLVPFEPNLIKYELLSEFQMKWLNFYHQLCLNLTGAYLREHRPNNHTAIAWLEARTRSPTVTTSSTMTRGSITATITSLLLAAGFSRL